MGSIIQGHELSLHCKPTYIPRTVSDFLGHVSMIGNVSDRLMKFDEFIKRLEDELRKIDAFKRELPLCMLLINDAIIAVKEESKQCRKSKAEPILEQFIPLKKSCDEENDDDKKVEIKKENDSREKMNWLSSVQLWNNNSSSSDNRPTSLDLNNNKRSPKPEITKRTREEENRVPNHVVPGDPFKSGKIQTMGMAFVPFKGHTSFPVPAIRKEEKEELPVLPGLTLQTPGIRHLSDESSSLSSKISGGRISTSSASNDQSGVRSGSQLSQQQQQQQNARKQRRCWSPELHRRFVDALQQLGGTQVATPKQIRELMQVDGLTNDEVKSHLQKYRLHTRKAPASSASTANQTALVLGGLWPAQDQSEESSKRSNSQSGSPQGPIQLCGASRGTSMTGGDSMEDEDDEKSESHSWKSHLHSSEKIHV